MGEKVYFLETRDMEDTADILSRLNGFLRSSDLFDFIVEKDFIAVKTHFGEDKINGFINPKYINMIGKFIRNKGGNPFLTETSTLYKGNRSNGVDHIKLAVDHGFSIEHTGMPIIMADGINGGEEVEVEIGGKIYDNVKIASILSKIQGLIVITHFTGHIISGFGGSLKNIGMGLASRKGKMVQHSTSKPSIKKKKCTACGECIKWCPVDAIEFVDGKAKIDSKLCIGCAECLAVCRFDAVVYNWSESYEKLQRKIVEHAFGVSKIMEGKVIYFNFLMNISKDCDCMGTYKKITDDIGILISKDPVAIDNASLYLIEKRSKKKLSELSYDIPYRVQIEHSDEINLGTSDFELIDLE